MKRLQKNYKRYEEIKGIKLAEIPLIANVFAESKIFMKEVISLHL